MKIHSIYLVAPEPDRLAAFYEGLLDARPKVKVPGTWIQFQCGETQLAVSSQSEASPGAVGATIVFEVADLDVAIGRAQELGATLVQSRDMGPHGKTASMRDPAGNIVQFLQKSMVRASDLL